MTTRLSPRTRRRFACALAAGCLVAVAPPAHAQQSAATGAFAATVTDSAGVPLPDVLVRLEGGGDPSPHFGTSDRAGHVRIGSLLVGPYTLSARRLGYKEFELPVLTIAPGQTTEIKITMAQTPAALIGVKVGASPVDIQKGSTEFAQQIDAKDIELLPMGRDASSLVNIIPGATLDQMWGGGGQLANNFELDGVSVNHPGYGGDFLTPSIDWVQTLEVKGLGAGAANGNFQGGIINVVTKTGSNVAQSALRVNYEGPWITGSNFNLGEQGSEQAGRQEVNGERSGPIIKDRLFYYAAFQYVNLDTRVPDLDTNPTSRFRPTETNDVTARGIAKLTYRSERIGRIDALLGFSDENTNHAGLTGFDDPASTQVIHAPTTTYELAWSHPVGAHQLFDLRTVGYVASQTNSGYSGANVPGVQDFSILGPEPQYQNAAFTDHYDPTSIGIRGSWSIEHTFGITSHKFQTGVEYDGGTWRDIETRNGGVTWRPPVPTDSASGFNALNPQTWPATESYWGGNVYLHSQLADEAVYAEDAIGIGKYVTVTPGLRFGSWTGWLLPDSAPRFKAVSATGFDPRFGVAYDVTGVGDWVVRGSVGRYHQGMATSLFDRVAGSNAYQNTHFCEGGPPLASTRTPATNAQMDSLCSVNGYPALSEDFVQNQTGPVQNYHQPYMDQLVLGTEKRIADNWKISAVFSNRQNHDFVGLVDENAATDYVALHNLLVFPAVSGYSQVIADPYTPSTPLVIPTLYIRSTSFNPDYVFTTIPQATRQFRQYYLELRGDYPMWTGDVSYSETSLKGNVPGVLTDGGVGTSFTPGPWAEPNELINAYGNLPGTNDIVAKGWVTVKMPAGFTGGATVTHDLGERATAYFQIDASKFFFITGDNRVILADQLQGVNGQTVYLEPLGNHFYGDRTIVDLHLDRHFVRGGRDWVFSGDLFNALAAKTITEVKTLVDGVPSSSSGGYTTYSFGAPLLRVPPITLRLGARVAFGATH